MNFRREFKINQICSARLSESIEYKKLLINKVIAKLLIKIGNNLQIVAFFGFYFSSNSVFNVEEIFKCLGFIGKLAGPVDTIPIIMNVIITTQVSNSRLFDFLDQPDTDITESKVEDFPIDLQKCYFSYCSEDKVQSSENYVLKDISLRIKKGERVGIVGNMGSGKSSLLRAISRVLFKLTGDYNVCGSVALVSEIPWLFTGTIRDNIILDQAFDSKFYFQVLEMFCLTQDLMKMEKKDLTWCVQKGNNFSTGQKARIVLARAVYSRRDLVLIDDVFANIDPTTVKLIVEKVLLSELKNQTVVFVSNNCELLKFADKIVFLKEGEIETIGTFEETKEKYNFDEESNKTQTKQLADKDVQK